MKEEVIKTIILFILTFIVVFIVYQVLYVNQYRAVIKNRKDKKALNNKRKPVEIRLLQNYYKVDVSKLKYSSLLNKVALVSSLDISLIVTIACIFDRGYLQIIVAFLVIAPVLYLSYLLLAICLKHKIKRLEKKGRI